MNRKKTPRHFPRESGDSFSRALIETDTAALLKHIHDYLSPAGTRAYIVGGFVRDALLGRETADIDLAVTGDALALARGLTGEMKGTFVLLDEINRVGRVVLKPGNEGEEPTTVDVSSMQGTIDDDLARRDFTIDAMAVDLGELVTGKTVNRLLDPFHGRDDLDRGIIRAVSDNAFSADPVRLLRAARLATELSFTIEPKTAGLVRKSAGLLANVPGERVREELLRLFNASRGGHFLLDLDELGLLTALFPELALTKGVTQPAEHHWDVFTHSIMCVSAVDYLLHQGVWGYPPSDVLESVPWSPECARHFEKPVAGGSTRRTLLKLAALLHDIAKPQTKAPDETGRIRFLGHQEQGEAAVTAIMERLRFSGRETKMVAGVVKYHLRPTQMGEPPSRRAIYRYFRDTGDAGIDILYLSLADHLATRGPDLILENWRQHTGIVRYVLEEHFKKEAVVPPPKLVDGNVLMDVFGLVPGPRLGELLESIREAQAAGELTTREQALDYIRDVLSQNSKL
ncbi:MAG: HD domain-containing protein [Dehalococcoidia bacterium]|nr:HD domain-containing protein [Dehalococcoidia bacterium]